MRSRREISVPVVGYVLAADGRDIGYIMPLATAVPSDSSFAQKKQYMAQIISLVEGMHGNGLLHGCQTCQLLVLQSAHLALRFRGLSTYQ